MHEKEKNYVRIDVSEHRFEQIYIEITNNCNWNCEYCFNSSSKKGNIYMKKEEIFNFVKSCKFKENNPLVYLSGGEPLLHKDIVEIVNSLIEKMNCNVKILSNGIMINDEIIENLNSKVLWQIGSAFVSTPKMMKENWELYKKNIELITSKFPTSNITLAFTITNKNYSFIEDYISEFNSLKNVNILLSFVQERGRGKICWDDIKIPVSVKMELIEKYADKLQNVKFCGINLDKNIYRILNGSNNAPKTFCEDVIEYYVDYKKNTYFCNKIDVFCKCKGIAGNLSNNGILKVSNTCSLNCELYKNCMMSCISYMKGDECICKIM